MNNFTTNTYEMKRDIANFSKEICKNSNKPETKFVTDMIYGMFKSKDILLSSIADALDETTKKHNTIGRLSDNLASDLSPSIDDNYTNIAIDSLGNNPLLIVDDSDVVKPCGNKFEDLGIVRDGSSKKKEYEKGYRHTEIVGLTKDKKQPISVFSKVHSSTQKDYVSNNNVTYEGIAKTIALLDKKELVGTFVMDRGYDSNDIFNYFFSTNHKFVIRLTKKRKIYCNHKWYKITTLRDSHKGKIKMKVMFQGEEKDCYVSVLRCKITAQKKWINVIFVYGLGEEPMMLATNIDIKSKEDVVRVSRYYLNRWRIEEYFKFKKQEYHFENFRVRSLKSINNINKLLTYTIGLIAILSEKKDKRKFVNIIIKESKSLRDDILLWFYQISRGIYNILSMARTGIRGWENIRKQKIFDGQLSLF